MKKELTEIVFILDRSGSMGGLESDTIGGYNAMIERQKEKYGWEFIFLGANIDAVEVASRFGIGADRAANYHADREGTQLNYEVVSEAICSLRASKTINAGWKERIDRDYKGRKKN